ncbi:MAG: phytochelatin synthase family protein [Myxococcota bacterium]
MSAKRIFAGFCAFLLLLALGFAGYTWWRLQPRDDPQPLPPALLALESPDGQQLLEGADAIADYQPLTDAFEHQSLVSFCGVASAVAVLNAAGGNVTQHTFFTDDTDAVRTRFEVMFGGMALAELAGLLEAHGADVTLHHAGASTVEEFRAALEENLSRPDVFMLVNYKRAALGQGGGGHISPLAAYDQDTDRVLILDTAGHKYPPTWVPVDLLFSAMATTDAASGKTRGFLEVARGDAVGSG